MATIPPGGLSVGRVLFVPTATGVEALVDDGAGRLVALGREGVAYCTDLSRFVIGAVLTPLADDPSEDGAA